ncbi:Response regulator receiver protein [uncultured Desulfobacterium sp.]|uniref:Response regulator receiver protein n=1 Tax=uncultured Desulfobacterium sp. TaxID=201089 RepID=A0A445MXJ9_9BACT|nr:Response regulator receiver protein [uncultured Desulfobacterium sp.]
MNKILVVDDDYLIRLLYQMELEEEGYNVTSADDFSFLFELIEDERPDVILMDIGVGEKCGLDTLRRIRETFSDIAVVIYSARELRRYDTKAIDADCFVKKDVDLRGLKSTVKTALANLREGSEGRCLPLLQVA